MPAPKGGVPKFAKFPGSQTVYVNGQPFRGSWQSFVAKYGNPKIKTLQPKDVYMYDAPGAKQVYVDGIAIPDWGELQAITGKQNPTIRKEKTPDFYKYKDNATVYQGSVSNPVGMDWQSFQNTYGQVPIEQRSPAVRQADMVAQYLQPTQQTFSDYLPYDQFWNPQRDYVTNRAMQLYRPEFEQYQLNPFEQQAAQGLQQLQFGQGLSGAWRTGKAQPNQQKYQEAVARDRGQLEMGYGDTIQSILGQYQQQVANPYYEQLRTQYGTSPNRNVNPDYKSQANDFLSQYGAGSDINWSLPMRDLTYENGGQ